MRFKLKRVWSSAIAIAICYSPVALLAEDQAHPQTVTMLGQCVTGHEATRELEEKINERLLNVNVSYSHYEIAARNLEHYVEQLASLEGRIGDLKKTDILYVQLTEDKFKAESEIIKWSVKKEVALTEMGNIMYGVELKIERLRNLRIKAVPCKDLVYTRHDREAVCEIVHDTRWCRMQF